MSEMSSVAMSIVAGILGLLGLFVASRAVDTGFLIFGLLLALFAVVYIFTAIHRGADRKS